MYVLTSTLNNKANQIIGTDVWIQWRYLQNIPKSVARNALIKYY